MKPQTLKWNLQIYNLTLPITNYQLQDTIPQHSENQQLADDFNEFYCRFGKTPHTRPELSTQPLTPPATPLSPTPALKISEDDMRQVCGEIKEGKGTRTRQCVTSLP